MVVGTRSSAKMADYDGVMVILNQMRESMATKDQVNLILSELKARDEKIEALESTVSLQTKLITDLTSRVSDCERNIDDVTQYSKRLCLRIDGIPAGGKKETEDICLEKVRSIISSVPGLDIPECSLDRAHRVGPQKVGEDGTVSRQMIVKFTTWRHRTALYRKRKDVGDNIYVSLDITKRRIELKKRALALAKDDTRIDFVFVDVNCNPGMRLKSGKFLFFNSIPDLDKAMSEVE